MGYTEYLDSERTSIFIRQFGRIKEKNKSIFNPLNPVKTILHVKV